MGGKTQQSSQQVTIPPEVLARYNAVNAHAEQTAQQPFQQYASDPNAFVAPLTAAQNQGLQATSDYANAAQPGIQNAMGMTQAASGEVNPWELTGDKIQQYMNPYTKNVTEQMGALMNQQADKAQSGQLGSAIQSNAFGGDRSGIAAAALQGQNALSYGNAMAPVLQQGYNTALQTATGQQSLDLQSRQANMQRMMSGANQYGQLAGMGQQYGLAGAQAMMGAGQVQQQTQQAGLTALYNQFLQQQSYPFQVGQYLANIAEGTGALSGQTTTSTQPSSFMSDRRLKENIKRIGTAKNGLPIHSFNYKEDPDKLTRLGFMADEVEKKHPEAVGLAGGYKTVDYSRAARASGGGIVTDLDHGRGYADGGMGLSYDPSWQGIDSREASVLSGKSPTPGLDPYTAANRHVPKQGTSAPSHRMLQPGQMPGKPMGAGAEAVGLIQKGLGLYDTAKGVGKAGRELTGQSTSTPAAPTETHEPEKPAAPAAPPAAPAAKEDLTLPAEAAPRVLAGGEPVVDAAEKVAGGLDPSAITDVFAARGGRIGRDGGGGVAPVVTGAPFHGPDVVTPTKEYLGGLDIAKASQQRANDIQAQTHAEQMADPTKYFPDQSPFGAMMNARGLYQSVQAQGLQGPYDPSGQGFHFAEGGSIPGGGGGGEGLDIPDDKSWQQDKAEQKSMEPAPSKGGGDSGGGALGALGQVAGLATKVLPLLMLGTGGLAGRRRRRDGGTDDDGYTGRWEDNPTKNEMMFSPEHVANNTGSLTPSVEDAGFGNTAASPVTGFHLSDLLPRDMPSAHEQLPAGGVKPPEGTFAAPAAPPAAPDAPKETPETVPETHPGHPEPPLRPDGLAPAAAPAARPVVSTPTPPVRPEGSQLLPAHAPTPPVRPAGLGAAEEQNPLQQLGNGISGAFDQFGHLIQSGVGNVVNALTGGAEATQHAVSSGLGAAERTLTAGANAVAGGVNTAAGGLAGHMENAKNLLTQRGQQMWDYMANQGYANHGEAWCGEFTGSLMHAAGIEPPKGAALASNWSTWGQHVDPKDVRPGDVAVAKYSRFYPGQGVPVKAGEQGSHVGVVQDTGGSAGTHFSLLAGNQSKPVTSRAYGDFEFRRPATSSSSYEKPAPQLGGGTGVPLNWSQVAYNAAMSGDRAAAYKNNLQGILATEENFDQKARMDSDGHWVLGYGSQMTPGENGKMRYVQEGDTTTPEQAYHVMKTRMQGEKLPVIMKQVGATTWTGLPTNVREGLSSVAWNYGSLPPTVVAAVKTGDRNAIAQAVAALPANRERRIRESKHILGG